MTLLRVVVPLLLVTAACGYRGEQRSANDVSYTNRTNKATTVTVYPPDSVVGTTQTTSSALVADTTTPTPRRGPMTAAAQPEPSGAPPDRRTSEQIERALASDPTLHDVALDRVRVVTSGGQVMLSGLVPTLADKVSIEQRVREVKGVEAVDNRIEVLR